MVSSEVFDTEVSSFRSLYEDLKKNFWFCNHFSFISEQFV
jgi:hypothetical protein